MTTGDHMGPPTAPEPTPTVPEEELDLNDDATLKPENLRALLARAKRASREAVKKTRLAFDTTKALADIGMLRTARFNKKKINSNGAEPDEAE